MLKAIIFDFDGTLADTELLVYNSVNKHAQELGYSQIKSRESIKDKSLREVIFKEMKIPLHRIPYVIWKGRQIAKKELKEVLFFKGIKEVFLVLQKEFLVGIVTSNTEEVVQSVFNKEGVKPDFLICKSNIFDKSNALKKAIKKSGAKKNEVVYVADEIRDINSCFKVGINFIGVSWGYNTADSLSKSGAKVVAKTPQELLNLLDKQKAF